MVLKDFYYDLPQELIAQFPATPRDAARLMCLDRKTGEASDHRFSDIESMLCKGDLLVINDSRVIPARLIGSKLETGAAVELLLLNDRGNDCWECLVKPGKKLKTGARVVFGNGALCCEIVDEIDGGNRIARFSYDKAEGFYAILDKTGLMPLPHYITGYTGDINEYQTVYANERGSAAAPTAGLHFTNELLGRIEDRGVNIARVTLHVGLGTFRPVKENDITQHHMHSESYSVSAEASEKYSETRKRGGRVIAVGTTSCRTLESVMNRHNEIIPCRESTDIFMYPGYSFKAVDGLITNFHLPESTLIMLVSAFAGYENTMNAYRLAVERKYRFFSFGDAMFIR